MPDGQVKDIISFQVLGGVGGLHKAQGRDTEPRAFRQICEVVGSPKPSPCDHGLKGFLQTLPVSWVAPGNCIKWQHPACSSPFEGLAAAKHFLTTLVKP